MRIQDAPNLPGHLDWEMLGADVDPTLHALVIRNRREPCRRVQVAVALASALMKGSGRKGPVADKTLTRCFKDLRAASARTPHPTRWPPEASYWCYRLISHGKTSTAAGQGLGELTGVLIRWPQPDFDEIGALAVLAALVTRRKCVDVFWGECNPR